MIEILVVDDDTSFLKSMVIGLQTISSSLQIHAAENGLKAIEILKKHNIYLVVTDLIMPQVDGFQLLAHIMEHYPDIAVVVITGHSLPSEQNTLLTESVSVVLYKPFALEELVLTVAQIIEKQSDGGTLHNVSPGTFMQLINLEQKTCTLRITDKPSGKQGILFFHDGILQNARLGELQGEVASLEIFSWDHISLSIQNDCQALEKRIERDMNALILEATTMKDEKREEKSPSSNEKEPIRKQIVNDNQGDNNGQKSAPTNNLGVQTDATVKDFIQNINHDPRWNGVLSEIKAVGNIFTAGNLKAFSILTGGASNYIIIPTNPPTVLTVDARCNKETLYKALQ
jgi:CheY-like chemotaxis protein